MNYVLNYTVKLIQHSSISNIVVCLFLLTTNYLFIYLLLITFVTIILNYFFFIISTICCFSMFLTSQLFLQQLLYITWESFNTYRMIFLKWNYQKDFKWRHLHYNSITRDIIPFGTWISCSFMFPLFCRHFLGNALRRHYWQQRGVK